MAIINADLSPLEIYGAELIDLILEQATTGASSPRPILFSCLGGDFSLPLPKALRRVSLIVDLDSSWDEGQQRLDQLDTDSLLLVPAMRTNLSDAIAAMDDGDRKYIEPVFITALQPE